jgi:signal transduction histidine kinase
MDQSARFAWVLEGSRQLNTALAGTREEPCRRAQLLAQALQGLFQPPLAACLIKTPAQPALSIVPADASAAPVAKEMESWAQSEAELADVALSAAPDSLILCGERIQFAKTIYGMVAAAVRLEDCAGTHAVLAWAAELLAVRFRLEECARQNAAESQPSAQVDLGELTGIVTHQFNNILNDIVLQLAVLERRNLPADARAEAVAIRQRSQQAAALVKELQRYGRSFHEPLTGLDLNAVVRSTLEGLCASAVRDSEPLQWLLATGKRLPVQLDLTPGLPAVVGAAADVKRLLVLLLHSAAAALQESGGIQVHTRPGESGPQLVVEDGGPGVAAEMLPRLFEPFTIARPGDDGMRLAVCRSLARRMQANLRGDNRTEGGMAFTVSFLSSKK